ncbi:MAG: AMP-binding protein [Myxococcota bacterium]
MPPAPEAAPEMLPPRDHDVGRWVEAHARHRPHALAWADDHRRCDFATAARRIERLSGWFAQHGVAEGDRIAVWLGNRGATLEAVFAAARLGAVVLPVNARLTAEEVAFQLSDCRPSVVLVERDWAARATRAISAAPGCAPHGLHAGGADDAYDAALAPAPPTPARTSCSPDDAVLLMYTSGTTGKPKGALLPLRKTLYKCLNAERYFGISANDRVLVVAPLFHSLGLQILALPAIFGGAGLVIQEGFDATRVWRSIEDERVTYYGGVPTMHQRLLDALERGAPLTAPPDSLRFAFTAGAAAPSELIQAYHARGLAMMQGYGQTETSILTCLDSASTLTKTGSVGRPVFHAEVRLVDPQGLDAPPSEWRDVNVGEVGEIVVAGPITMLGYWERPEANAETLRGRWLRTGDLATRDADFDVTLVGRAREMYISGGENVYPAEVEATLVEHPDVHEAAVVAVPDETWGEVGIAFVAPSPGGAVVADDVSSWLASRLAGYKQPRVIHVVASLPRTASGKVQKHRLPLA